MMSREDRQIRLIEHTLALAAEDGVDLWLRGGWAVDFYLGTISRPHEAVAR